MSEKNTFYLVREEILPEAIKKTIKVKEILKRGEIKTINEAVETIGKEPCGFRPSATYEKASDVFLTGESYETIEKYGIVAIIFKIIK